MTEIMTIDEKSTIDINIQNKHVLHMTQHADEIARHCRESENTRMMLCDALTASRLWDRNLEKKIRGIEKIKQKHGISQSKRQKLIGDLAVSIQKIRNIRMRDITVIMSMMHGLVLSVDKSNANHLEDIALCK
jgi:hypothetical protein